MAKHRKSHRRRRHTKRRSTRRMMYGGSPANVGSYGMDNLSLPAGKQYLDMHRAQHGGAASLATMGMPLIPEDMNGTARVASTYAQMAQIRGLSDLSGGRRRRRGRKGKKTMRRSRSRKMRGGALMLSPAEVAWKEAISVPQGVNPQFASWDASA